MDKSADKSGYFPCGDKVDAIEVKAIKLPEGLVCEGCVLQLSWRDSNAEYYTCSDVIPSENDLSTCLGKKEECKDSRVCGSISAAGYKRSKLF